VAKAREYDLEGKQRRNLNASSREEEEKTHVGCED